MAFTLSEVQASPVKINDEDILSSLLDSFSVALVKKDKVWMGANIAEACKMYDPSGAVLSKTAIIKTFSEGIYDISKSSVSNKAFIVNGTNADGSADFSVEGIGKVNGDSIDLTGMYKFSLKFSKSDKGWQIAEITVN